MSIAVRNANDRIRHVVAHTLLFSGWSAAMIEKLIEGAEMRRFEDGEMAIRSGQPSPHLTFAMRGCFTIERPVHNGKPVLMDFLLPGQATSHLAVFDGLPAAYNITAVGESEMAFLPRKSVLDAIALNPAKWADIVLMLCRRLRIEYESVHLRTNNTLRCQLAKVILYWSRGHWDEISKGVRIPLPISQENIAAMLGKSRPTINKEIGALIAEGILARSYRQIQVSDLQALRNIIEEEDPGSLTANEALFTKPLNVLAGSD